MKRILFVIDTLGRGGAERGLIDLLHAIDRERYSADLLTIFNGGELAIELPPWIRRRSLLPDANKRPRLRWLVNALRRRIEGRIIRLEIERDGARRRLSRLFPGPYDVVVAFLEGMSTYLVAKSRIDTARKIAWVHVDLSKHSTGFFGKRIPYECYKGFNAVGIVSKGAFESFSGLAPYPEVLANARIVPMPVDIDRIRRLSLLPMDLPTDLPLVAVIARLHFQKRVDRAIRAHANIIHRGFRHRLAIAGDGPERARLECLAKELGVDSSIEFLGSLANPYPLMRKADLILVPSDYEGYSLVVAESLLLEKPIVSTSTTGPVELLGEGKYGRLSAIDDAAFESAMEELLSDRERRAGYVRSIRDSMGKLPVSTDFRAVFSMIEGIE